MVSLAAGAHLSDSELVLALSGRLPPYRGLCYFGKIPMLHAVVPRHFLSRKRLGVIVNVRLAVFITPAVSAADGRKLWMSTLAAQAIDQNHRESGDG